MTFSILFATLREYKHTGISDTKTLSVLLNDTFGDWLASQGVSHIEMLNDNRLCMNIRGQLKEHNPTDGIKLFSRFLVVNLDEIQDDPEAVGNALESYIKEAYTSEGDGAFVWIIPDGYMASLSPTEQEWEQHGEGYFSHESICISNTAGKDTLCLLDVLYEDTDMENVSCEFNVPAQRSVHYRLDKLKDSEGNPLIAKDAPVSYKITSKDARIVVQGSRILTSGEDSIFASFGTVMAWCPMK